MQRFFFGGAALSLIMFPACGSTSSDAVSATPAASGAAADSTEGGSAAEGGSSAKAGSPTNGGSDPARGGSSSGGSSAAPAGGSHAGNASGGQSSIPTEGWTACEKDQDCVTVPENSCCGCNPFGVNRRYEADARAEFGKFRQSDCPPLGCAGHACPPDPVPICQNGKCSWKPGCSSRLQTECAMDAECRSYEARPCGSQLQTYVTCSAPSECTGIPVCAMSPDGLEFMFPDGCIPLGWTGCPSECN